MGGFKTFDRVYNSLQNIAPSSSEYHRRMKAFSGVEQKFRQKMQTFHLYQNSCEKKNEHTVTKMETNVSLVDMKFENTRI